MAKNKKTLIKTPQASKTIIFDAWRELMKLLDELLKAAHIEKPTEGIAVNATGDIENIIDTGKAIKFTFEGSRSHVLLTKTGYQLHGDTLPLRWQFTIENYLKSVNIENVDDYPATLTALKVRNEAIKTNIINDINLKKPTPSQIGVIASSFVNNQTRFSREVLYNNLRIDPQLVSESERTMIKQHITQTTKDMTDFVDDVTDKLIDQTNNNFLLGQRATDDNAKDLAKLTKQSVRQSKNLLVQQAHRTNSETIHINARKIGLNPFIWRTVENEKVCPICAPLNGKLFKMTELPKEKMPGFIHPHCNCYRDLIIDQEMRDILQEARRS